MIVSGPEDCFTIVNGSADPEAYTEVGFFTWQMSSSKSSSDLPLMCLPLYLPSKLTFKGSVMVTVKSSPEDPIQLDIVASLVLKNPVVAGPSTSKLFVPSSHYVVSMPSVEKSV